MNFAHYLKFAFRSLLKHRQQNLVSAVGLSVGLVCFILSTYWIRYEWGYDRFQSDRDRIFRVQTVDTADVRGYNFVVPSPLADFLKKNLPEIEGASNFDYTFLLDRDPTTNERVFCNGYAADLDFFKVLNVKTILGDCRELFNENNGIVITRSFAEKKFGRLDVVGDSVVDSNSGRSFQIKAVIEDRPLHTNFPFQLLTKSSPDEAPSWTSASSTLYIRLKPGVDLQKAIKKIEQIQIPESRSSTRLKLVPLSELHYSRLSQDRSKVPYKHILLFAAMGALVVICSVVNYTMLFVARLQVRGRELLLRKVNGASNGDVMLQLLLEITLTLLLSALLGLLCIEWILPRFKELALIKSDTDAIFTDVLAYFAIISSLILVVVFFPVSYYRKKSYIQYIQLSAAPENKNLFRRASLLLQLAIAIGFIFCISVFMRQMYHFMHSDLAFDRKNVCSVSVWSRDNEAFIQEVSNLTAIQGIARGTAFLPEHIIWMPSFTKEDEDKTVSCRGINAAPGYIPFFKLDVAEGDLRAFENGQPDAVVINQVAARQLGVKCSGDNRIFSEKSGYTVVAVVRDPRFSSPIQPVYPMVFFAKPTTDEEFEDRFFYRYRDGEREKAETAIREVYQKYSGKDYLSFRYMEEEYRNSFQSERIFQTLLGILSAVCALVALFGVYAMISFSSEQRRREMAIRKANGAAIGTILMLFVREYLAVTTLAAVLIFPVGYLVMQPWVESYSNRIEIGFWIYPAIWLAVVFVVLLTVMARVWKIARINPAIELKKE